jgi:asparagine synthase (glutamine-hydrolysing)
LTGEGADEIFGGYIQPHFSAFDYDRCPHYQAEVDPNSPFYMAMTMLYGRAFFINDTDHYTATTCWLSYQDKTNILQEDVWQTIEEDNAIYAFYEDFFNSLDKCSTFDKRMHLHAEFNLENLLARVDNSTMAASVEARVPFNDHRLSELAFSMPDSYKMDWKNETDKQKGQTLTSNEIDKQNLLESKKLPRYAFIKDLPSEITTRPKMSFPVPFSEWFYGPLFQEIKSLCLESKLTETIFNKTNLENIFQQKSRNIWLIANLCQLFK